MYGGSRTPFQHVARLMVGPRLAGLLLWVACALWLVGCAQPPQVPAGEEDAWNGRIALQVEGQASQSFSAIFELRGNAQTGGLALISPLGSRIGAWASLQSQPLDSRATLLKRVAIEAARHGTAPRRPQICTSAPR